MVTICLPQIESAYPQVIFPALITPEQEPCTKRSIDRLRESRLQFLLQNSRAATLTEYVQYHLDTHQNRNKNTLRL
jgi:hypothetical protein